MIATLESMQRAPEPQRVLASIVGRAHTVALGSQAAEVAKSESTSRGLGIPLASLATRVNLLPVKEAPTRAACVNQGVTNRTQARVIAAIALPDSTQTHQQVIAPAVGREDSNQAHRHSAAMIAIPAHISSFTTALTASIAKLDGIGQLLIA